MPADKRRGMCSAGLHGVDYEGQRCALCEQTAAKPTVNHAAAVAEAAKAVDEAWQQWDFICDDAGSQEDARDAKHAMVEATIKWLAARRIARAAGYVECMVSKEAVAAFKRALEQGGCSPNLVDDFMDLLVRDLAGLLNPKEPGRRTPISLRGRAVTRRAASMSTATGI